jgi:hypothetical protein
MTLRRRRTAINITSCKVASWTALFCARFNSWLRNKHMIPESLSGAPNHTYLTHHFQTSPLTSSLNPATLRLTTCSTNRSQLHRSQTRIPLVNRARRRTTPIRIRVPQKHHLHITIEALTNSRRQRPARPPIPLAGVRPGRSAAAAVGVPVCGRHEGDPLVPTSPRQYMERLRMEKAGNVGRWIR